MEIFDINNHMSNIIEFPPDRFVGDIDEITRRNKLAEEENREHSSEGYRYKRAIVEQTLDVAQNELLNYMHKQGFSVDEYEFVEDFSFAMECLRSCLLGDIGIEHPIQKVKPSLEKLLSELDIPDS